MFAEHYENQTMLSRVTSKNVGGVFWDTVYFAKTHVTPNHWHQTVVCYQATRVRYPHK